MLAVRLQHIVPRSQKRVDLRTGPIARIACRHVARPARTERVAKIERVEDFMYCNGVKVKLAEGHRRRAVELPKVVQSRFVIDYVVVVGVVIERQAANRRADIDRIGNVGGIAIESHSELAIKSVDDWS